VTVSCPLECEYLQDARKHEKPAPANPDEFPNRDVRINEEFLRENEELLVFVARSLFQAAMETAGAADYDMREALDALIRTYRTLESGVYYETRPNNLLAAAIYQFLRNAVAQLQQEETQRFGVSRTRDTAILGMLVFLQRLELVHNNARKRGRAFIDFLRGFFGESPRSSLTAPLSTSLVIP